MRLLGYLFGAFLIGLGVGVGLWFLGITLDEVLAVALPALRFSAKCLLAGSLVFFGLRFILRAKDEAFDL